MKTSLKLAVAFLSLAGLSTSAALAQNPGKQAGEKRMHRFERMDTDKSGDVTFEEFAAVMKTRFSDADADNDGKMTVGEIASEIQKMRAERMAKRIVKRFDADGDGALTAAEIDSRQKKVFALMDKNDDGKITQDEMPTRKGMRKMNRQN